jgi:hypothetical protein
MVEKKKKKQKIAGAKRDLLHGTNSNHFLLFVEEMVVVLIKLSLHNMYIVTDNAAIHKTLKFFKQSVIRDILPYFTPLLANVKSY